jgi:hypothetical protein
MSSIRPTTRALALGALTALGGVALGLVVATFARETVEAGAPAFRTAFTHAAQHAAMRVHTVPQGAAASEPVDYLPEHLHPEPAPTTGESAEVPTF